MTTVQPGSMKGALSQGLSNLKAQGQNMLGNMAASVGTQLSLPMIQKFRQDLKQQMSNTSEWEKKPIDERQAIFNEIKEISKLQHQEGTRAWLSRRTGVRGGKKGKGKRTRKVGKKSRKSKKRR
jgi:hypothetical protein